MTKPKKDASGWKEAWAIASAWVLALPALAIVSLLFTALLSTVVLGTEQSDGALYGIRYAILMGTFGTLLLTIMVFVFYGARKKAFLNTY